MGEATVSPLLIGYSPINSACGALYSSLSRTYPLAVLVPLFVLESLLMLHIITEACQLPSKQYLVLSLPSLCSPNRLQSPRHGIH